MATLREIIKQRGLTNKIVTDALGVSTTNIGRYDDLSKRSIDELTKISGAVNMTLSELIIEGIGVVIENIDNLHKDTVHSTQNDNSYRLVPIINSDAVAGMHKINNVTVSDPEFIKGYIPFTDALEDDLCIPIVSDSMIPTCPPGCIVLIREVPNWREYFGFGNLFVIQLKDGRRIIKEVTKCESNPKDYILCISHNRSVPPEELPKNFIVSVWKVIKVLTDRGW